MWAPSRPPARQFQALWSSPLRFLTAMGVSSRAVPRDLFPLPRDDAVVPPLSRSLGRHTCQRISGDAAIRRRVNECVDVVNSLHGGNLAFEGLRPSEAQARALQHITDSVFCDKPPESIKGESPQASFSAMLGFRASLYPEDDGGSVRMAPLRPDSDIAWPARAGSMRLIDALPSDTAEDVLNARSRLSRPSEEFKQLVHDEGKAGLYTDPLLRCDDDVYATFVCELLSRNMAFLSLAKPLQEVGIFFVVKKSGQLRIIFDARRVNQGLVPPPPTRLASPAALAELQINDSEDLYF